VEETWRELIKQCKPKAKQSPCDAGHKPGSLLRTGPVASARDCPHFSLWLGISSSTG
jgi:hypothetical protein